MNVRGSATFELNMTSAAHHKASPDVLVASCIPQEDWQIHPRCFDTLESENWRSPHEPEAPDNQRRDVGGVNIQKLNIKALQRRSCWGFPAGSL